MVFSGNAVSVPITKWIGERLLVSESFSEDLESRKKNSITTQNGQTLLGVHHEKIDSPAVYLNGQSKDRKENYMHSLIILLLANLYPKGPPLDFLKGFREVIFQQEERESNLSKNLMLILAHFNYKKPI